MESLSSLRFRFIVLVKHPIARRSITQNLIHHQPSASLMEEPANVSGFPTMKHIYLGQVVCQIVGATNFRWSVEAGFCERLSSETRCCRYVSQAL